jgi:hypothetical protein
MCVSVSWIYKTLGPAIVALFFIGAAALAQESIDDFEETQPPVTSRSDIRPISDTRLDQALAQFRADEDLQTVRPEWEPEPVVPTERTRRNGPNPIAQFFANLFGALGQVAGYLLVLLIVIAILGGLYLVFGERFALQGKQREKQADPDLSITPNLKPAEAQARALLEDADALAAAGRFAEAVHLLLFRSIDEIQSKRSGLIERSLTSREIGALGGLPDSVRETLSPIIQIVERSFFGGQDVGEAGWNEARASYETFAFGAAWT